MIAIEIIHRGVKFMKGVSLSEKIAEKKENKIRIPPENRRVRINGNHLFVDWIFI
jgi:hypothetical protein